MPRAHDSDARKFYVYMFFRADGRPLYVGRGTGNRWRHHLRKTDKSKRLTNGYLRRALEAAGGDLPFVKVGESLTLAQANELEVTLIRTIGRGSFGPLVNLTEGGDGCAGLERTEAHKKAIGAAHKGRKWTWEHRAAVVAQARTPESRKKSSERVRNFHANMTPEQKAARAQKISDATRAAMTPEICARISAKRVGKPRAPTKGNTGQKWSDAQRAKMREAIEARKLAGWHSSETAAKISAGHARRREAKLNGTI